VRVNLGCGRYKLPGYENWDENPLVEPDRCVRVPPIPAPDDSVSALYMGHLLEHLAPDEAAALLRECHRVLVPGGTLGVVVPDIRRVLECYLRQDHTTAEVPQGRFWELDDLDDVCAVFLYSTFQDSPHRWSYDAGTLRRALTRAGFTVAGPIDPWRDPRLVGAFWNVGFDAVKLALTEAAA
jgi:SAM-dependent methyltransferase